MDMSYVYCIRNCINLEMYTSIHINLCYVVWSAVWLFIHISSVVLEHDYIPYLVVVQNLVSILNSIIFVNYLLFTWFDHSQSVKCWTLSTISLPKMSWPGITCRVVWYVDLNANATATKMPAKGSSRS
jgi:hypothetical protein